MRPRLFVFICLLAPVLAAAPAGAAFQIDSFSTGVQPSMPTDIAPGPDGNMWYSDNLAEQIGRITPQGVVTRFPAGTSGPSSIAAGPDGGIWFTSYNDKVSKANTDGTVLNHYDTPTASSAPFGITGALGQLYYVEFGVSKIAKIGTSGLGSGDVLVPGQPSDIVEGPDGFLWIAGGYEDRIVKAGGNLASFFFFPVTDGSRPVRITVGPDGALWWVANEKPILGRTTTAGVTQEFPIANADGAGGIVSAFDGTLWVLSYTEPNSYRLHRFNTSGQEVESQAIGSGALIGELSPGPPGTNSVWMVALESDQLQRITIAPAGVPGTPNAAPSTTLSFRKRQRLAKKRKRAKVSIDATCNETCSLQGDASLVTGAAKKSATVRLGQVKRTNVAAGKTTKLSFKFSKRNYSRAKRALRNKRKLAVSVTVAATDAAGARATRTAVITLRR